MSHISWSETQNGEEWDEFVARNGGSIFHTWSWRKVLESAKSKPLYLAYRDKEGKVLAVCPFIYRKGGRRLKYLLSLPSSPMAGPIIGDGIKNVTEIMESLGKSVRFSPFNPVVSMQIRVHQQPTIQSLIAAGYRYEIPDGLFILDLQEKSPDHIWNNEFQKHDRQAVKYYEGMSAWFGFARNEQDYADYLTLHEESIVRGKERPLIPPEFLTRMRLNMGEHLNVTLVTLEDKLVAGFSMICDPANSIVHLQIIGYSRSKNMHSPIVYIDWKTINWAFENGFRYVDFSTTSSDPTNAVHKLKERMGGAFMPRYRFTLPAAGIPYSFARRIRRTVRDVKSSMSSKGSK